MVRLGRWTPRRPQRHAIRLACQVVRERDFKLISRQIIDLSEVGMRILPEMRCLTGESLIVSFMAPFSRTWVDAEATVARVDHGRRPLDSGTSLGIYFDKIDEHARALLKLNLASVPPPLPGRRLS